MAQNICDNIPQVEKQYVNYDGSNSELLNIQLGIPQGSILGPMRFLICINDIKDATSLNLLAYADDTTVYKSGAKLTDMIPHINHELMKLNQWFKANKLSLNTDETNCMIFAPNKGYSKDNMNIMIDGKVLKQAGKNNKTNSVKFLGLYLDENITWKYHIDQIQTKISRSIYAINLMKISPELCITNNISNTN